MSSSLSDFQHEPTVHMDMSAQPPWDLLPDDVWQHIIEYLKTCDKLVSDHDSAARLAHRARRAIHGVWCLASLRATLTQALDCTWS
jgi:hypothetical protein